MKAALFLHGFLSDPEVDFGSLFSHLTGYDHLEKIYFPGHGGSTKINYWDFYAVETIIQVLNVCDKLLKEYETLDVYGYSMGGAIGMYVASVLPINKLVLLTPAYKYLNFNMILNKVKFNAKYSFNRHEKSFAKEQLRIAKENDFIATRFFARKYFKLYIAKALKEFKTVISFVQRNTYSIKCSTLVCYGMLDELVPKKSILATMNKIENENKKLVVYENMTHLMLASVNPDEMIKEIIEFVG